MMTLNYEKGFDRNAFMNYLSEKFNINSFAEDVVNNIIDYAHEHEHISKDQFADFISDMLPDIEFAEVTAFCEDCCLTRDGIKAKHDFWNEREAKL